MNCQILLYKKKKPSELEFTSLFFTYTLTSFRARIPCVHWVDKKLYRGWQSSAWSFLQDQWRLQKLTAIVFNWDHQAIIDQRPSQTPECTLIPGHSLHKQKQKLLGGKLGILSPQDWDPLTLLKKSHRYHVWFILWYMLFCVCETSKLTLIYGLLWVKNLHFWLLDLSVKTLYWHERFFYQNNGNVVKSRRFPLMIGLFDIWDLIIWIIWIRSYVESCWGG